MAIWRSGIAVAQSKVRVAAIIVRRDRYFYGGMNALRPMIATTP